MSQLREQLRLARAEYKALAYPGELAAELLPPRHRMPWGRWALIGTGFGAGSLAAAAAIALALVTFLPSHAREVPGEEVIARVTASGTFARLSRLPSQFSHLTSVVPVETFRSTLHLLGLPSEPSRPEDDVPPRDADHAAA